MQILTHRGLEPLNPTFLFSESTKEAFQNHLERWFWLEFDVNFTKDGVCFVFHDSTLKRITNGRDIRDTKDIPWDDIQSSISKNGTLLTFDDLLLLIDTNRSEWEYSALHLKSKFQNQQQIDSILWSIKKHPWIEKKLFLFDIKLETARYIKSVFPELELFPSVAHAYDIKRYNECTGYTLLSIWDVLDNVWLFSWVWLDEWDKIDENGGIKALYTKEVFSLFRSKWLKIWLVTPELHATSPWLLWSEAHEDAKDIELWKTRMSEVLSLSPDFVCTDYIQLIKKL